MLLKKICSCLVLIVHKGLHKIKDPACEQGIVQADYNGAVCALLVRTPCETVLTNVTNTYLARYYLYSLMITMFPQSKCHVQVTQNWFPGTVS